MYRRDKISAISAVTVSPNRRRLGLCIRFHSKNITGVEVIEFLRLLLARLRGPVVLLWDGGTIHKRDIVKDFLRRQRRLHVYPFPSYAPDLNPDEGVWNLIKGDLANSAPRNTRELSRLLYRSARRVKHSQRLLQGCIDSSDLPWP